MFNNQMRNSGANMPSWVANWSPSTGIETFAQHNGQPSAIYNLNGQHLTTLQRGLNIKDGKKVMVK